MFMFLYNVWYFFLKIVSKNEKFFKNIYKNNFLNKVDFSKLSLSSKIFLSIFSHGSFFENNLNKTISNDIVSFRKKHFPLIAYFHSYNNSYDYKKIGLRNFNRTVNFVNKNNLTINSFFKTSNLNLNIFLLIKFLEKNFYPFFSNSFFKKPHILNLIKVNFIILVLLNKQVIKNLKFFNLNKYEDWYNYNFRINNYFFFKKNLNLNLISLINKKNKKVIDFYKVTFFTISEKLKLKYNHSLNYLTFAFDRNLLSKININNLFNNALQIYYPIRFNEVSTNKYIELNKLNDYCFFFLRKNRIFNKGRYSRNRQTYRTGVYWCLWVNILSVIGFYFLFYRVTFNFGYLWLVLIIFFASLIFSRVLKYNFFNLNYVARELRKSYEWFSLIYFDLISFLKSFLNFYFIFMNLIRNFLTYKNLNTSNLLFKYLVDFPLKRYLILIDSQETVKFNYVWKSLNTKDESVFKFRTLLSYINQLVFIIFTSSKK